MKTEMVLVWALVVFAFILVGLGGWLDLTGKGELAVAMTSRHAWNDALFLMLLAILIAVVAYK